MQAAVTQLTKRRIRDRDGLLAPDSIFELAVCCLSLGKTLYAYLIIFLHFIILAIWQKTWTYQQPIRI